MNTEGTFFAIYSHYK